MPTVTGRATDFIQFTRASNATVTDSDGKIKWAPHNLLLASEQFNSASWTKAAITSSNPSVVANAGIAPNGTTTADRVNYGAIDAAGDVSTVSQLLTLDAATYTGGVWIKAVAAGDVGKTVSMYLNDGSIRGQVFVTVTADWQYVTTSAALTGGASRQFQIATVGSDFGGANQAAVSVYLWGAHLYRSDLGGMQANTSAYPMYNPTTPKNLLGFSESLTTGWTNTNTTDAIASEVNPVGLTGAVDVAATAGNGTLLASVSLLASPYTFSIWLKRKTGSGDVQITVDGTTYVTVAVTSTWTRFSTTLTPSAGTKTPGIRLVTSGDAVYAWGAQLSDSASLDPYVPNYFAAPSAAAYNGPRLDYDPSTLAAKGLLVEEQRSNVFLNTTKLESGWTATNVSVVTDTYTSPDGTLNASKLNNTATGVVTRSITQNYNFPATGAYTMSVYAKADTADTITFNLSQGFGKATFNLSTGAVTSVTGTASITSVGNGWYRCSLTVTVGSTGIRTNYIYLYNEGNSPDAAIGNGLAIYGAQLEAGSFATSYIPTGAATATRSADVASVSTQAFPYSSTEGTIVVNLQHLASPSSADQVHWQLYTTTRVLGTDRYSTSTNIAVRGLGLNADTGKSITTNVAKVGTSFTSSEVNLVVNGGTAYTNTSASGSLTASFLYLGHTSSSNQLNGWVRQVTYLPRKLTVSELQARTV